MIFASYNNIISPLGFSTKENYQSVCDSVTIENTTLFTKLEQLSILSIQDVITQSGIDPKDSRTLLIYSTTKGNIDLLSSIEQTGYNGIDVKRAYLPAFANHLQTHFKFKNTPVVLSNACVSGILAIVVAKRFIDQGLYDNVIVCGGDILSEFTLSGFKSFNAISNEPCKPFDENRTGINLGEAVASILITNNKTLASPYSTQIIAGASANDANHISGPSRTGDGLLQCLERLNLQYVNGIGFISAHGTATPFNDEMESIAFERANLSNIPINSLKGYYGHTLGAAGVLETILSLESLHHQRLIKSVGYSKKGVSGNVTVIETHQPATFSSFIKTASGFGGCNTAALFTKL
jgi:3-oxoacyl-[acyl-carrier-protein] synthase I